MITVLACRKRSNRVIGVAVVDTFLDFDTNRVVGLSLTTDRKVLGVVSWLSTADAQRFAQVDVDGRRSHLGVVEALRVEGMFSHLCTSFTARRSSAWLVNGNL